MAEFDFGKSVGAGTGLGSEKAWAWEANLSFYGKFSWKGLIWSHRKLFTVGQFLAHKNPITKIRPPTCPPLPSHYILYTVRTTFSKMYPNFLASE